MAKKIAILGWGSLLWEGGQEFDRWHEPWQYDGPLLKLEFSRVSKTRLRALTLVIDPRNGTPTTVAYCLSKRLDPEDTICDLRCREGTTLSNIGYAFAAGRRSQYRDKESYAVISAWAKQKGFDAAIWTDLVSNFHEEAKQQFSAEAAIVHLKALAPEGKAKAAEYVWRAPGFVRTPLRQALEGEPWFLPLSS